MPRFRYTAKESPTKRVTGFLEAESASAAVRKVLGMGCVPVEVEGVVLNHSNSSTPLWSIRPKISSKEVMLFTRQISDLMTSGVSVHRSLQIISRQTRHDFFRNIQEEICNVVKRGSTLSEALAQFPDVFPVFYVNMVRSGEMGGNLALALRRLADLQERDYETRRRLQSSLIYPLIIFTVGAATLFILFSFVVPRLTILFEDFGASLPVVTRILIGIGTFCSRTWWALPVIAVFSVIFLRSRRFSIIREKSGNLFRSSPLIGNFLEDVETERFLRILGTLLGSGVLIVPALRSASGVLGSGALKKKINSATEAVLKGSSLKEALGEGECFSPAVLSMIAVGEETGQLADNLCKIADSYESRVSHATKTALSLLEPVCIIIIGGIVGFIVMAMLLPVFRLNFIIR